MEWRDLLMGGVGELRMDVVDMLGLGAFVAVRKMGWEDG